MTHTKDHVIAVQLVLFPRLAFYPAVSVAAEVVGVAERALVPLFLVAVIDHFHPAVEVVLVSFFVPDTAEGVVVAFAGVVFVVKAEVNRAVAVGE